MIDVSRGVAVNHWTLIDHDDRDGPKAGLEALTAREREVVHRAMAGNSNKTIAYDLGIADATVRVLLWRAYGKVGVRSRRDLIAKAFGLTQMQAGAPAAVPPSNDTVVEGE
jgi:DNA-binding CsgD family transcriptional regulator